MRWAQKELTFRRKMLGIDQSFAQAITTLKAWPVCLSFYTLRHWLCFRSMVIRGFPVWPLSYMNQTWCKTVASSLPQQLFLFAECSSCTCLALSWVFFFFVFFLAAATMKMTRCSCCKYYLAAIKWHVVNSVHFIHHYLTGSSAHI